MDEPNLALTFLVAIFFAAIHIVSPHVRPIRGGVSQMGWLSFAGGLSVGYVFIHVLPELATHQADRVADDRQLAEGEIFFVALMGLAAFYWLEHLARATADAVGENDEDAHSRHPGFWLHTISFSIYGALIGYILVVREGTGEPVEILFYGLALGVHFFINDRSLSRHHGRLQDRYGRWILAASVLTGWALGAATGADGDIVGFLFAFLAGGVILNALKEELPEERQGRVGAFILGAAFYGALSLAV
jgi:hypothetical protein